MRRDIRFLGQALVYGRQRAGFHQIGERGSLLVFAASRDRHGRRGGRRGDDAGGCWCSSGGGGAAAVGAPAAGAGVSGVPPHAAIIVLAAADRRKTQEIAPTELLPLIHGILLMIPECSTESILTVPPHARVIVSRWARPNGKVLCAAWSGQENDLVSEAEQCRHAAALLYHAHLSIYTPLSRCRATSTSGARGSATLAVALLAQFERLCRSNCAKKGDFGEASPPQTPLAFDKPSPRDLI